MSAAEKTLVIVESPTKAKTIRKFLGADYIVESCMGHVRDLPQSAKDIPEKYKKKPWSSLGVNVDEGYDPIYCVPKNKTKIVKELKGLLKEVDEVILATDEDREGESISWHLLELLKPKVPVKRMVFHEITKTAIQKALDNFREIDSNLVKAQEARRILDRLVGYTISPLIWKKVAYGLSAGRVQSVAVKLIVERELERRRFVKTHYFGVYGQNKKDDVQFETRLSLHQGKRIASGKDFDPETGKLLEDKEKSVVVITEDVATQIAEKAQTATWTVKDVEERPLTRRPSAPFITSTLQQEANRKLGLSAKETMQVAQKLYEEGYITYMRTDSTFLSEQALMASRQKIEEMYGAKYVPEAPRGYQKKKVKGAQEAHEAIRPAGTEMLAPDETKLKTIKKDLYELIWKRTMASQMTDAQLQQVSVKFDVEDTQFSASGQTVTFAGFMKAYSVNAEDEKESRLPQLKTGDEVKLLSVQPKEHETKPVARFNEASIVQKMEKEGIGRPSTYASIISTIIDRGYVMKNGGALVPTFTAMVVSKLLTEHLPTYVDLGFTSDMEKRLDDIATGDLESKSYLKSVYAGDGGLRETVQEKESVIDPEASREIRMSGLEELSFRVGRYGAYVCRIQDGEEQCASLQDSMAPADISADDAHKLIEQKLSGADALGQDPESGLPIYVLNGRYGPYVQLGDVDSENSKPKRTSIPAPLQMEDVDMEKALFLLSLPKTLGQHTSLDKDVKLGIGRFGPYVVCDGDFRSVPKSEPLFEVNFEFAMNLLSQPKKGRGAATALKEFGEHPEAGDKIQLFNGKYGPYVKCGKVNASLEEGMTMESITAEQAIALLEPKIKKKTKKKAAKKSTAKKATKKTAKKATKKKATKKAAKKTGDEEAAPEKATKTVIRRKKS